MSNKTYRNHIVSGQTYKPLLHKKGKQWIVVGLSTLMLATFGFGLNVPAHAATNTVKANINHQLAHAKVNAQSASAQPAQANSAKASQGSNVSAQSNQASSDNVTPQAKTMYHSLVSGALNKFQGLNQSASSQEASARHPLAKVANNGADNTLHIDNTAEGRAKQAKAWNYVQNGINNNDYDNYKAPKSLASGSAQASSSISAGSVKSASVKTSAQVSASSENATEKNVAKANQVDDKKPVFKVGESHQLGAAQDSDIIIFENKDGDLENVQHVKGADGTTYNLPSTYTFNDQGSDASDNSVKYNLASGQPTSFNFNNGEHFVTVNLANTPSHDIDYLDEPVTFEGNVALDFYVNGNSYKTIYLPYNITTKVRADVANVLQNTNPSATVPADYINKIIQEFNTKDYTYASNANAGEYDGVYVDPNANGKFSNTNGNLVYDNGNIVLNFNANQGIKENIHYMFNGHNETTNGTQIVTGTNDAQGDINSTNDSGLKSGWHLANNDNNFIFGNGGSDANGQINDSDNVAVLPDSANATVNYQVSDGNTNSTNDGQTLGSYTNSGWNYQASDANGFQGKTTSFNVTSDDNVPAGYHLVSGQNLNVPFDNSNHTIKIVGNMMNPNGTDTSVTNTDPTKDGVSQNDIVTINEHEYSNGKQVRTVTQYLAISGKVGEKYTLDPNNFIQTGYQVEGGNSKNSAQTGNITSNGISLQNVDFYYDAQTGSDITVIYQNQNGTTVEKNSINGLKVDTTGNIYDKVPMPNGYHYVSSKNNGNNITNGSNKDIPFTVQVGAQTYIIKVAGNPLTPTSNPNGANNPANPNNANSPLNPSNPHHKDATNKNSEWNPTNSDSPFNSSNSDSPYNPTSPLNPNNPKSILNPSNPDGPLNPKNHPDMNPADTNSPLNPNNPNGVIDPNSSKSPLGPSSKYHKDATTTGNPWNPSTKGSPVDPTYPDSVINPNSSVSPYNKHNPSNPDNPLTPANESKNTKQANGKGTSVPSTNLPDSNPTNPSDTSNVPNVPQNPNEPEQDDINKPNYNPLVPSHAQYPNKPVDTNPADNNGSTNSKYNPVIPDGSTVSNPSKPADSRATITGNNGKPESNPNYNPVIPSGSHVQNPSKPADNRSDIPDGNGNVVPNSNYNPIIPNGMHPQDSTKPADNRQTINGKPNPNYNPIIPDGTHPANSSKPVDNNPTTNQSGKQVPNPNYNPAIPDGSKPSNPNKPVDNNKTIINGKGNQVNNPNYNPVIPDGSHTQFSGKAANGTASDGGTNPVIPDNMHPQDSTKPADNRQTINGKPNPNYNPLIPNGSHPEDPSKPADNNEVITGNNGKKVLNPNYNPVVPNGTQVITPNQNGTTVNKPDNHQGTDIPDSPADADNTFYVTVNDFSGNRLVRSYIKRVLETGNTGNQFQISPDSYITNGYTDANSGDKEYTGFFGADGLLASDNKTPQNSIVWNYFAEPQSNHIHYINQAGNDVTPSDNTVNGSTDSDIDVTKQVPVPAGYHIKPSENTEHDFNSPTNNPNNTSDQTYVVVGNTIKGTATIHLVYQESDGNGNLKTDTTKDVQVPINTKVGSTDTVDPLNYWANNYNQTNSVWTIPTDPQSANAETADNDNYNPTHTFTYTGVQSGELKVNYVDVTPNSANYGQTTDTQDLGTDFGPVGEIIDLGDSTTPTDKQTKGVRYILNLPKYAVLVHQINPIQLTKDNLTLTIGLMMIKKPQPQPKPAKKAINSTILVNYVNRATGATVGNSMPITRKAGTDFDINAYLDNIPSGYAYDGMRGLVDKFDNNNHTINILLDKDVVPSKASAKSSSAAKPSSASSAKNGKASQSASQSSSNIINHYSDNSANAELNSLTSEVAKDNQDLASIGAREDSTASSVNAEEETIFSSLLNSGINNISSLAASYTSEFNTNASASAKPNTNRKAPKAVAVNDLRVGQSTNLDGTKVTRLTMSKHFRWFMVTSNTLAHINLISVGTPKNAKLVLRPNHKLFFRITKIFKVTGKSGRSYIRYEFKVGKHNYFVTGNSRFTKNSYLQIADFKKSGLFHIRLLKTAYEYNSKHFSKKSFIRRHKAGSRLAVKAISMIGRKGDYQTRLELADGHFITANKNWVKLVK